MSFMTILGRDSYIYISVRSKGIPESTAAEETFTYVHHMTVYEGCWPQATESLLDSHHEHLSCNNRKRTELELVEDMHNLEYQFSISFSVTDKVTD